MIMEVDNPISIEYNYSTNTYRSFTVTCHHYDIHSTVTSKPSVVRTWLKRILYKHRYRLRRDRLIVGLGVQWTPNTNPGRPRPPPATLQLCAGHQCLIFQLLYARSVPNILHRFLSNPAISFVGVAVHNDGDFLRRSRHNLFVSRLIELRHVADARWVLPRGVMSMERLAEFVLGLDGVVKPQWVGNSDWDLRVLSDEQVEYASIDAFISCLLGRELKAWNWDR